MAFSLEHTIYYTGSIQALRYSVQTVYENRSRRPQSPEMLRLVYIRSGHCTWLISGKPYDVSAGDIVLLNNTEQRLQLNISPDDPVKQEIIRFSPIAFGDCAECMSVFFSRSGAFSNVFTGDYPQRGRIIALIDWMREEAAGNGDQRDITMLSVMRLLLILLCRTSREMGMTQSAVPSPLMQAQHYQMLCETVTYIKENLSGEITVGLLANRANISRSYFSRVFHALMGMSVPQFVRALRINMVQKMTANDEMKLLDAIFACGFGSVSAYYKALHCLGAPETSRRI